MNSYCWHASPSSHECLRPVVARLGTLQLHQRDVWEGFGQAQQGDVVIQAVHIISRVHHDQVDPLLVPSVLLPGCQGPNLVVFSRAFRSSQTMCCSQHPAISNNGPSADMIGLHLPVGAVVAVNQAPVLFGTAEETQQK
eukprot:s1384_g6.t1